MSQSTPPRPTQNEPPGAHSGGPATEPPETPAGTPPEPSRLAEGLCRGFRYHDDRRRDACHRAFFEVDRHQFVHLIDRDASAAARGFVTALWEKDAIERRHTHDGSLDRPALREADWSPVRTALERRAAAAGIDPAYAALTTAGWRAHKTDEDYWTPLGEARVHELRVALQEPEYPDKSGDGSAGVGPLASRYLLGVELHDAHTESHWQEAVRIMTPYFEAILESRGDGR